MNQVKYRVVRSFKYNGRLTVPGEEFVPGGGRFDAQLVNNPRLIERVETWQDDLPRQPRRKRGRPRLEEVTIGN